ncbi:MAG TPA: radical SAM family heme chaperone HemW [Kiritimatiellia bacterium]|nr:radical SAM family heme chaperone HemW [Kiritimatiellia bacterium]
MPGLYIHVPFCARKCAYCDFYSVPLNAAAAEEYLRALDRECGGLPDGFAPETVFIGGGTPTVLPPAELARLLDLLARRVNLGRVTEWTCEANPVTLDAEKIRILRGAGVNRVSLGVQSFDDGVLKFLGRLHTAREAVEAFRLLRAEGFDNIGLDLMCAVPGGAIERDLERALALGPEHLSVYGLTFEDGTPLARRRDAGEVAELDEDEQLRQFRVVRETLKGAGFHHYEISNYARPGRECRHNLLYWGPGEYLGLGPAAHSHWGGQR